MNIITLALSFLIVMFVVLGGCSKSSPPTPAPQAPKKVSTPEVPAVAPKMATSMATSSTLSKTAPGGSARPAAPMTPEAASSSSIKGTNQNSSEKPAIALITGVAPTVSVKPVPSAAGTMLNPGLTSALSTSMPAKLLDSSPVYSYNPEGKKDPFMTYLQGANPAKTVKTSIPLLNYSLGDLKLVAVMVIKKNKFLAMVQTPDSKGYVVKLGMEIGINHGRVHEINDHSISVEEEFTEIGGEKKKRTVVLSLHPPEEGQL
jgi:type IV pilus assembly protein PilP